MPATMKDVKNKTGLSMATISKYLNGGNVLPENRILIENAIKELHYEVNEIARGLVKNKTKTVGIMVYDISSFFSSNILHYIGMELRKHGYGMMICDSNNDEELERENVKFLLSRKVDGLIVLPVAFDSDFLKPAKKANIPVVLMDRTLQDEPLDCVCIDNRAAVRRAINIFIQHHHKKIAIIGSDVEDTGIERMKGYKEAMESAKLPMHPEYIKTGRFSVKEGYDKMEELLNLEDRPTAVFLSNYETALGAIMAVNDSNFSYPEDISIIAFDDLLVSNVLRPSLYMVVQPMETLCMQAVQLLLQRIEKEEEMEPVKLSFSATILEGESVRDMES